MTFRDDREPVNGATSGREPPGVADAQREGCLARKKNEVLDARAVERTLKRMAEEITELNGGTDNLIIVGIQRRGVQLATRLAKVIEDREKTAVRRGSLDITLYRDDLQTVGPRPVV